MPDRHPQSNAVPPGTNTPQMNAPTTPADLARAIVRGTIDNDPFQMHGAIVAVLETYLDSPSRERAFHIALAELAHQPAQQTALAAAVRHHLAIYRDSDTTVKPRQTAT